MPKSTQTTINSWDPHRRPVDGHIAPGDYTNADTSLILAGPPRLDNVAGITLEGAQGVAELSVTGTDNIFFPIGTVQNWQKSEAKQPIMIPEIGSSIIQIFPTKAQGFLNMTKIFLDGPSMLRALTAIYGSTGDVEFSSILKTYNQTQTTLELNAEPGNDDIFLSLFSDLYNFPIGLMLLIANQRVKLKSGLYFENAYITAHNMGVSAGATNLIGETVNISYSRSVPAKVLREGVSIDIEATIPI